MMLADTMRRLAMYAAVIVLNCSLLYAWNSSPMTAWSQSPEGVWYLSVERSTLLGTQTQCFKLVLERKGRASLSRDSTSSEFGFWSMNSSSDSCLISFQGSEYSFLNRPELMYGIVREGGSSGTCIARRERTLEFDSLVRSQAANTRQTRTRLSTEFAYLPDQSYLYFRLAGGYSLFPAKTSLNGELVSFAVVKHNSDLITSSNYLLPTLSFLLITFGAVDDEGKPSDWAMIPLLPIMLTNFDISVPLGTPLLTADVMQSTDLFTLTTATKIIPQTSVGIMVDASTTSLPLQLRVAYSIPWVHGWLPERTNHLSAGLNVMLR